MSKESGFWYSIKVTNAEHVVQIGVVQLQDKLPDTEEGDLDLQEFIAISAGEFLGVPGRSVGVPWDMLDDWELKQRTRNGNVYEFYNVMLIERCDGIARRRGLGRVPMSLWKDVKKEEVEIVLG